MRRIACCFFIFCAVGLFAQNASPLSESDMVIATPGADASAAEGQVESVSGVWVFVRMVLVLAVVIAAIYGVIFFLKKMSKTPDAESPYIRHISGITLAPGKTVHIVTVGSRGFILGAADNAVSLVSELTDQELIDSMNLNADQQHPVRQNFADTLAAVIPFLRKKDVSAEDSVNPQTVLSHLTDRLSNTAAGGTSRPPEEDR